MILSVFVFSSLINFLYETHTNTFNIFIALIMIGYGIFLVITTFLNEDIDKGKKFFINLFLAILIGFYLASFHTNANQELNPLLLALFGFIACSFLLFPGISGSAFLLSVGAYPLIIGSISNIDFGILFPFGIGMLMALVLMPRLINKAYKKFGKSMLVFFGGLIFSAGMNYFL